MKNIYQKIKKVNKTRTLRLLLFLSILIALPLILNSSQKQQNLKQNAQTSTSLPIYGVDATALDGLAPGWTSHITFGTAASLDLANKSPFYKGVNSIRYTVTAPFDGFDLTAPQPIDISSYKYLTFYIQAGAPGQRFNVILIGTDGRPSGLPVAVSTIFGYWSVYNIPISQFATLNKTILGIGFQDANGGNQNTDPPPPTYFDEINFSQKMAPEPDGAPASIAAPTPKAAMPYYPNISPWVFIIPVVIILAVIIFQ